MSISDLLTLVELLNEAKIPNILVIGGILFLFVAAGGRIGAIIHGGEKVKSVFAGSIGVLLLFCGALLYATPLFAGNVNPENDSMLEESSEPVQITDGVDASDTTTAVMTAATAPPTEQSPTAVPLPSATPSLLEPALFEQVQFCGGCTSQDLTIDLTQGVSKGYVLRIMAGQTLYVFSDQSAVVKILDSRGVPLTPDLGNSTRWEAFIPQTGDYKIIVSGSGRYTLTFYIPPIVGR